MKFEHELPVEKNMNFLKKAAIAAAAFSMVASPVAASAAPVASLESARASAQLDDSAEQFGSFGAWLMPLFGIGLMIAGIATAFNSQSNDPTSP